MMNHVYLLLDDSLTAVAAAGDDELILVQVDTGAFSSDLFYSTYM